MAWKITIGGVDKTSSIDQRSKVVINKYQSERGTAKFTTVPGYQPALQAEVIIYDTDGVTAIFGGIIFSRKNKGKGLLNFTEVECVDFSVYTTWRHASFTFNGSYSLLAVMQLIVTNWLSAYGITLSGTQAVGPSAVGNGYTWTYKSIDQCLRDASVYLGNGTWSISPTKVIEMVLPAGAPSAPFSLTDANQNMEDLSWEEDLSDYATKVIVQCGGTGTKDISQTWVITSGDISLGYLETDCPSIPTGGVTATINGSPATVGTAGTQLIWHWETHRLHAGTYGGVIGDTVVLNYTAQFPFYVVVDSGVVPPLEVVVNADDIIAKSIGTPTAAGLLARYNQTPRKFEIRTTRSGLKPGQLISINVSGRNTGSVSALITEVQITMISNGFWRYDAKAQTGTFKESGLDYFRNIGGKQPVSGFTGGANPAITLSVFPQASLGGSREASVITTASYVTVPSYVPFTAPATVTATIRVDLWARRAGVSCTARLYDVTAAAVTASSSPITSTTATSTSFTANLTQGHIYRLEIIAGTSGEGVYGIGTIESM